MPELTRMFGAACEGMGWGGIAYSSGSHDLVFFSLIGLIFLVLFSDF